MQQAHNAIDALGTWELVELPQAAKVFGCSCVFKLVTMLVSSWGPQAESWCGVQRRVCTSSFS